MKRINNLDGTPATRTEQRGVVHTYTYDNARRLSRDGATTIPGGVDDAIKSIVRTYDDLGRVLAPTNGIGLISKAGLPLASRESF